MVRDLVPFLIILTIGLALSLSAWRSWRREHTRVRTDDLARTLHEAAHDGVAGPFVEWAGVAQKERDVRRAQARYLLRHFRIGPMLLCALVFGGCAHRTAARSQACGSGLAGAVQAKRTFKAWSKDYELQMIQGLPREDARARVDLTRPVVDKALDLFEAQTDALEQCAKDGGR